MIFAPAHAKLNLALSVVGRRPDGRHDLRSVVVRLDWHDLVGVAMGPCPGGLPAAEGGAGIRLTVAGPAAVDAPPGQDNLAARAAAAALRGRPEVGARIHLEKRIPAAAGLGGGSADAACVLRLLADAGALPMSQPSAEPPSASSWPGHPPAGLLALADGLGSDVPACLAGGSLLVGGAGERLEPITHRPVHLVVVVAGRSRTADTFAALRGREWRGPARPEALARRLAAGEDPDPALCGSDLEAAACRANPALATAIQQLRAATPGTPWHLTGSGGACFTLVASGAMGASLAARVSPLGLPVRVCRTVSS
jgi:4-diphosphocytidyl-2-C-methyl-D-erythritol kinase